jgi:hypothetical protein
LRRSQSSAKSPETQKQRQIGKENDRNKRHCRASGLVQVPKLTDAALCVNVSYQGKSHIPSTTAQDLNGVLAQPLRDCAPHNKARTRHNGFYVMHVAVELNV